MGLPSLQNETTEEGICYKEMHVFTLAGSSLAHTARTSGISWFLNWNGLRSWPLSALLKSPTAMRAPGAKFGTSPPNRVSGNRNTEVSAKRTQTHLDGMARESAWDAKTQSVCNSFQTGS
jgi:hypothetical protein